MKIVCVQYTTSLQYAAINQENIRQVVNELRKINYPGIKYSTYLLADGQTFMHFDQFENEEAHEFLTGLESFKKFADGLEASQPEIAPQLQLPTLVASTEDFWG